MVLKSTHQPKGVGTLNLILGALFALLATFNLISNIFGRTTVGEIIYLSIPFYALSAISLVYKSKVSLSYIFLFVAIYSCVYNSDINDYSAAILFCFAVHARDSKRFSIFVAVLALICLSLNSAFFSFKFNTVVNLVIAYTAIYIIYYFLAIISIQLLRAEISNLKKEIKHQHVSIIRNIDVINISEEDKAILNLYCNGVEYDKISNRLGLNVIPSTVRRKITAIKTDNKLNNDAHFARWLFKKVEVDIHPVSGV